MGNYHKLVHGRPVQNGIEGEVGLHDVEQDTFHAEVLRRPECDREGDTSTQNARYCPLENGHDGQSFDISICSFLKAAKLIRCSTAPPSIRTCYGLTLMMVRKTSSGTCLPPAMLLGQSEASKLIDVSIHLWCGAALGAGTTAATSRRRFLMMCNTPCL
jgi:hypothetical protein